MPIIDEFQEHFNKALGLLGDVKSLDRTFLSDPVTLRTLASQEFEQNLTADKMAKLPGFAKVLKHLHPDEHQPDSERFNSNGLRKLSSGITINATAAILLAGMRVDGNGVAKKVPPADKDIEIAVLLHDLVGRRALQRHASEAPSLDDSDRVKIDDDYIRTHFSENILQHVHGIRQALEVAEAYANDVNPIYVNAVAAITAARVREAAKIVSVQLLDRLEDGVRAQFLKENKLPPDRPAFTLLNHEFAKLKAVMERREDVSPEIREPIEKVLMPPVSSYLTGKSKRETLHGLETEGNGQAYALFNKALPINRYMTVEEDTHGKPLPYTDLDVYKMLLLQVRYHQDTVRKDGSTIFSHVLDTLGWGEQTLQGDLRNLVTIVLGLHDMLEDGGRAVSNFNLSIDDIVKYFGVRMGLLAAEMTDDFSKKMYKARAGGRFAESAHRHVFVEERLEALKQVQEAAELTGDQISAHVRKYLESTTFNLATTGAKLADVVSTIRKSLEHPECNSGHWKNSGARVSWLVDSKGYVNDLYMSLGERVIAFFAGHCAPGNVLPSGHDEMSLNRGLLNCLAVTKTTLDQYALQNLTILADEFGLSGPDRERLRDRFTDTRNVSQNEFEQYLQATLKLNGAESLQPLCPSEKGAKVNMTTVHHKDSTPGAIQWQFDKIAALRQQFSQREVQRLQIAATLHNVDISAQPALKAQLEAVTKEPNWQAMDRAVIAHYDAAMGIGKERFTVLGPFSANISRQSSGRLPGAPV